MLKETLNIMKKFNITANKKFGQNFLISEEVLNGIVDVSNIDSNDLVIEIGPGLGNLTEKLIKVAKKVVAIEIDKKMIEVLEYRFIDNSKFDLINEDILQININETINKYTSKGKYKEVKIIGNLPYYITTPIIFKILEETTEISKITIMVQKEVAERIVAKTKNKDYGVLTIMTNYYSIPKLEFNVGKEEFLPSPSVDSSIVTLEVFKRYVVDDEKIFRKVVKNSFAQRRKTILNSLTNNFIELNKSEIEELLKKADILSGERAEEIEIEKYIKLSNIFKLRLKQRNN